MNTLILSAIPAFFGSLFLMHRGGAPTSQLIQQIVVFCVAAVTCAALSRKRLVLTNKQLAVALGIATVALFLPLVLMSGDGPRRWLGLGGFRLYMASVALPITLLLLPHVRGMAWLLLRIAAALAAQPDASQVTAFALASAALLSRSPLSLLARAGVSVALAGVAILAWLRPDPLQPVAYVEGVLPLALAASPVALIAALVALALPVIALFRAGQAPVALYYLAIYFFAYHQLTPMPLLGFGIGPILGYFGMASLGGPPTERGQ